LAAKLFRQNFRLPEEDSPEVQRWLRQMGVDREVLEQMQQAERDAWNSVELRLADRERELREAGQ
jgi:hypothetical protein